MKKSNEKVSKARQALKRFEERQSRITVDKEAKKYLISEYNECRDIYFRLKEYLKAERKTIDVGTFWRISEETSRLRVEMKKIADIYFKRFNQRIKIK